jgi:hypothetical protein
VCLAGDGTMVRGSGGAMHNDESTAKVVGRRNGVKRKGKRGKDGGREEGKSRRKEPGNGGKTGPWMLRFVRCATGVPLGRGIIRA